MKLAINYSTQAAELLAKGQIEIAFFKTPDWPWIINQAKTYCPVAVHFNLTAGNGELARIDWQTISELMEITSTPYLNLHLEARVEDFPGLPAGSTEEQQKDRIISQALADIQSALRYFKPEQVIVENVPYHGISDKVLRPCVEPATISYILQTSGCGLLFDISHARITAHYLGISLEDYCAQMPLSRTKEMHFTGMKWVNGKLTDHLECQESDWQALVWIFQQIRNGSISSPWLLAFEYGGVGEKFAWRSDPEVIAQQVPKLLSLIRTV
jgi:uncharacterized protein (UPF0276 family)